LRFRRDACQLTKLFSFGRTLTIAAARVYVQRQINECKTMPQRKLTL
jgi:hypothetical protein